MTAGPTSNEANKMGNEAVVLGAGVAGLLAARVLSDHFSSVTLVERDEIPAGPQLRKGQPQAAHSHGLLAKGLEVMTGFFPGLPDGLREGGGEITDIGASFRWHISGGYRLQFDSGIPFTMASKPLLEWQIRRRLLALPNVKLMDNRRATKLLASEDQRIVTGVLVVDSDDRDRELELKAQLVVDATGRESATPRWLGELDYRPPQEDSVKVDFGVTSRTYRRHPGDLVGSKMIIISPGPAPNKRAGLIVPVEGDRWTVTLAGWGGDHPPAEETGFLEFASTLAASDVYDTMIGLEPLTGFATYKVPAVRRFRYESLTRFPEGIIALGDALCSFNPTYGQGMTSVALQAVALQGALEGRQSLDGLWREYFKRAAKVVSAPWMMSTSADFQFPDTEGKKPVGTDLMNAYIEKVQKATHHDPVVHGAFLRVMNFMAPPASLFRPHIIWRALTGPTRG